jgi:hypothetical protein
MQTKPSGSVVSSVLKLWIPVLPFDSGKLHRFSLMKSAFVLSTSGEENQTQ